MFDSFQNLEGYIPNNRPKPVPESPTANQTISLSNIWPLTNAKGEIIGAEWNWGNPVDIPFETKGNIFDSEGGYIDLEEFLQDRPLLIEVLNQFYETYLSFELECEVIMGSESAYLILEIDEATSKQFRRGTNHVRITIEDLGIILYSPEDSTLNVR